MRKNLSVLVPAACVLLLFAALAGCQGSDKREGDVELTAEQKASLEKGGGDSDKASEGTTSTDDK